MTEASSTYDRLIYPGLAFSHTHPNRLAVMAALHGMEPASPACCRVLELGCGDAGNLIPMAYQFPDSSFLGIDLAAGAIERGKATAAAVGLRNISLRALDIMDVTQDLGTFDYIIAHGVYSWVPPAVRSRLLSVLRERLAPQGVAFISYNCYPGCHLRDLSRRMLLFHVRDIADPAERIQQARGLMRMLAEVSDERSLHGAILRAQNERISEIRDNALYHDDLDQDATAFFFHQMVADAAASGLQYLSDAASPVVDLSRLPASVARFLEQIPEDQTVLRGQYLDFITGTPFRETLFCHHEAPLRRPVEIDRIRRCQFSAHLRPQSVEIDPALPGVATFESRSGAELSTDHVLAKAAFVHLAAIWPETTGFDDLLAAARRRATGRASAGACDPSPDVHAFTEILFRSFCAGVLEIDYCQPQLASDISERPEASRLARVQAEAGGIVTNLRHCPVALDAPMRLLLTMADGTRSREALIAEWRCAAERQWSRPGASEEAPAPPDISDAQIVKNLNSLAALALLVR